LKKDAATLEAAYDDATGVTSAFDKNLLGRINRELGGDFDLTLFDHVARYDPARGAVDSFLVARTSQRVRIEALAMTVDLQAGEPIHTESSYKFSDDDIGRLARQAGFVYERGWSDDERRFKAALLTVR
jgi:L-histidine Nalpha-methyltransferase